MGEVQRTKSKCERTDKERNNKTRFASTGRGEVRRGGGRNILPSTPVAAKKSSADGGGIEVSSQDEAGTRGGLRRNGGGNGWPPWTPPLTKQRLGPFAGLHAARPAGAGRVPGEGWGRDRGGCWWQIVWWGTIPTLGLQEGELGAGGRVEGGEMRLGGKGGGGGRRGERLGVGKGVVILGLMALLLDVTWNVRRLIVRETNRRRLRSVAERVRQERWEMVLLTELRADEEGVVCLGEDEESVVLIHGKKAGVMLRGEALEKWVEGGQQKWFGERVVAVVVGGFRLVSVYQPSWGGGCGRHGKM